MPRPLELPADWLPVATLRTGGGTRPSVRRLTTPAGEVIVKDYAGADALFASLLGPLLAAREARALKRLAAVQGVPNLIERRGRRALVMQWLPAEPFKYVDRDEAFWAQFFEVLAVRVSQMHCAGVAHCDLRSLNNVLVSLDQEPCLVDFAACVFVPGRWNLPWRGVFARFCRADREALVKLKHRVAPALVSAEEKVLLAHRGLLARGARRLGQGMRWLSRALLTR